MCMITYSCEYVNEINIFMKIRFLHINIYLYVHIIFIIVCSYLYMKNMFIICMLVFTGYTKSIL